MKIVKESLNEIKRNQEASGLSAIGIGKEGIKRQIENWCDSMNIWVYKINDKLELEIPQSYYADIQSIQNIKIPPFINIKMKPGATAFILAMGIDDKKTVSKLLDDYKSLNIPYPEQYKEFIEDLEDINYICISTAVQFKHGAIAFIDKELNKIMAVYFRDDCVMIRRYDTYTYGSSIKPQLLKILHNANADYYTPIIDWLNLYRTKQKKKLLSKPSI